MAGLRGNGSVPSLPPPRPKSPPQYPDLYGKRREFAKVQVLEREIGFLEEELKSIEGLHTASKSCKEVLDFVTANADPLIPTTTKARKSCRFWKWLCRVSCLNFSWICCCSCSPHLELLRCSSNCDCSGNCNPCNSCSNPCPMNCCCTMPECDCSSCCNCKCFSRLKCSSRGSWLNCCCSSRGRGRSSLCCDCMPPSRCPSCPTCSCKRCCTCFYPKCPKFNPFSCCHNICCCPCYICY